MRGVRGFTLLEVMIAAVVLVGGMLSILGLFAVALAIHRANVDTQRVTEVRALVLPLALEEALVLDPETGKALLQEVPPREVPGHPGWTYALEFGEAGDPESGLEVATLVLRWRSGGRLREARSTHLVHPAKPLSVLIRTHFKEEEKP